MVEVTPPGVYFGYAQISASRSDGSSPDPLDEGRTKVHPMVMSLGWNPFYKNKKLTAVCRSFAIPSRPSHLCLCFEMQEIHIMHPFKSDFYGHEMRAVVLGYIRPELDYTSRGAHRRWFPITTRFSCSLPSILLVPLILFSRSVISDTPPIAPCVFDPPRGPH